MTGPRPEIDPALAAALDRYDVPAAAPGFADRIVAAASAAPSPIAGGPARRRDRRGPWTRRAIAGGLALVLGTTAVAAALLDRAGIHLPTVVAMLTPVSAPAPAPVAKHHVRVRHAPAPTLPAAADADAVGTAETAPIASVPIAPPRLAAIRQRLADLPPEERRAVVRRVVRRVVIARAIERHRLADGAPPLDMVRPGPARLAERPLLRAMLTRRLAAARERREELGATPAPQALPSAPAMPTPPDAHDALPAAGALSSPLAAAASPPATPDAAAAAAPVTRADRIRRLGELRRMRALRMELRRQRFR